MKLQFSLATLLVCMTVLVVVGVLSICLPVHERKCRNITTTSSPTTTRSFYEVSRNPDSQEIAWRLFYWGLPASIGAFVAMSVVRRVQVRPKFSLRAILVLFALLSLPLAWVSYQLNWIRERQAFLRTPGVHLSPVQPNAPWSLKIFGERGYSFYVIRLPLSTNELDRQKIKVQSLFPEATIESMVSYFPNENP